jgi:hypothetical protein
MSNVMIRVISIQSLGPGSSAVVLRTGQIDSLMKGDFVTLKLKFMNFNSTLER